LFPLTKEENVRGRQRGEQRREYGRFEDLTRAFVLVVSRRRRRHDFVLCARKLFFFNEDATREKKKNIITR